MSFTINIYLQLDKATLSINVHASQLSLQVVWMPGSVMQISLRRTTVITQGDTDVITQGDIDVIAEGDTESDNLSSVSSVEIKGTENFGKQGYHQILAQTIVFSFYKDLTIKNGHKSCSRRFE